MKGERGFFLFVALCLLMAAGVWALLRPSYPDLPENDYVRAEYTKYSPGSPACYPSRLNSLPDGEREDEKYRCETQAEKHRLESNDLVQQTRAADASVASVDLSYRQMLIELAGGVFGLLTLLAAGYAAWYARAAAQAGSHANKIASSTHEELLSPYMMVSKAWFEIDPSVRPIAFIELKNFGQAPAMQVRTWYGISVEDYPLRKALRKPGEGEVSMGVNNVGPGGTSEMRLAASGPILGLLQREIMAGKMGLYVFGESHYRDIFGNEFITEFTLFCSGRENVERRRLSPYSEGNSVTRIPKDGQSDLERMR